MSKTNEDMKKHRSLTNGIKRDLPKPGKSQMPIRDPIRVVFIGAAPSTVQNDIVKWLACFYACTYVHMFQMFKYIPFREKFNTCLRS